jgi:hypothetical protein
LYRRAQAYTEQKAREKNAGPGESSATSKANKQLEIDTKYTRSLEDIKEEYSSWLYEQKRNKKRPVYKTSITIVATIILLAVGYTAAKIVFQKNDVPEIAGQKLPVGNPDPVVAKTGKAASKTNTTTTKKKPVRDLSKTPVVTRKKTNTSIAVSKKPAVKSPVTKKEEKQVQVANKNPVFLPDQVKITGQYSANKKGIPDFNISVTNNSDQQLRFVAVDIFYYRKDGSLAGKKTLYFNKVAAHSVMTLTAPGNSKADDVIFKMGLMSNEKGELYYTKL